MFNLECNANGKINFKAYCHQALLAYKLDFLYGVFRVISAPNSAVSCVQRGQECLGNSAGSIPIQMLSYSNLYYMSLFSLCICRDSWRIPPFSLKHVNALCWPGRKQCIWLPYKMNNCDHLPLTLTIYNFQMSWLMQILMNLQPRGHAALNWTSKSCFFTHIREAMCYFHPASIILCLASSGENS